MVFDLDRSERFAHLAMFETNKVLQAVEDGTRRVLTDGSLKDIKVRYLGVNITIKFLFLHLSAP